MKMSNHSTRNNWIERSLLVLTIAFLFLTMQATAQVFDWARMGGGPGWKHGNGIAVDDQGNSYVVGEYSLVAPAVNPAISFGTHDLNALGVAEGFIVMYDAAGNEKWALSLTAMDPNSSVTARSIALFKVGSTTFLYVTGEIAGDVQFGNLIKNGSFGSSFIARYSVDNATQMPPSSADWVAIAGPENGIGTGIVTSRSIAVGGANMVYICGSISKNASFRSFQENDPVVNVMAVGVSELFVAKYDNSGKVIWVSSSVGSGTGANASIASATAISANGNNVAVIGQFKKVVSFGATSLTGTNPEGDLVVAKCDITNPNGGFNWAAMGASNNSVSGRALAVDDAGNTYVVGKFTGTLGLHSQSSSTPAVSISAVGSDFFTAQYDVSGVATWGKKGNTDVTSDAVASGVAVYGTGSNRKIFVTGGFAGRIKPGSVTVGSMGNHDIFVAGYAAATGVVDWVQRAGNIYTALNHNHFDQGIGITVNAVSGKLYLVGEFGGDGNGDARFFGEAIDLAFNHFRNVCVASISPATDKISGRVTKSGMGLPNHVVMITSGSQTDYVLTDENGKYTICVPPGTYFVNLFKEVPKWQWTPISGYNIVATGTNFIDSSANFIVGPSGDSVDLCINVTIQSTEYALPGSSYPNSPIRYLITYKNVGTASISNFDVTLDIDTRLVYQDYYASPVPSLTLIQNLPGKLVWNVPNALPSHGTGEIVVLFDMASNVQHEPALNVTASITKRTNDSTPNNSKSVLQTVFFPSDPNGKTVMPKGNVGVTDVRNGQRLAYSIHFFNQGAAKVTDVVVTDRLDASFSDAQATDITMSGFGPVKPLISPTVILPEIAFEFNLANLDPMHESISGSYGYVTFSVPLNRNLKVGTIVRDTASVTFVGQSTIMTNPVETCISSDFRYENPCIGKPTKFFSRENGDDYLWGGSDSIIGLTWNFGDGDSLVGERNPTHQFKDTGTFTVVLRFRFRQPVRICDKLGTEHTVIREVIVDSIPKPEIVRSGDTLVASLASHYQWYRNDTLLVGDTLQRYIMRGVMGDYRVITRNRGDCEGVSPTSGAPVETGSSRSIAIHPNPGTGQFTLDLGTSLVKDARVSILDVRGEIVYEGVIRSGETKYHIDLRGQSSGMYTATLMIGGQVVTQRLILQR